MLWQRVGTAAVGIPVTMILIYYGGIAFFLAVLFLALLGYREYAGMLRRQGIQVARRSGTVGIILLLAAARWGNSYEQLFIVFLFFVAVLSRVVVCRQTFDFSDAAATVAGFVYVGLAFTHFILLRMLEGENVVSTAAGIWPAGVAYLFVTLLATWAGDVSAYFVGSWWGRHKMCPQISPGKSWEGWGGGIVGTLLVAYLVAKICGMPLAVAMAPGVIAAAVGPLGDLVESAIKRFAGVKDSGRLLPGHGGVLDRLDSLMFTVPFVYFYVQSFIGF